jgi:hypothetical protein
MIINTFNWARASAMVAVALFVGTASSQATVNGSLWENFGADNADVAPSGSPNMTFTSSQIYFGSPDDSTISGFLNYGGTTTTILTGAGDAGNIADNLLIRLTGQIYLTAGANAFQVGHDDGLNISVTGIGTVLDQPGPTGFTLTPFNITAPTSGYYDFTLDYNECCGAPAYLEWAFPSGAPITGNNAPDGGTTITLLGLALTGLGTFARRLKK